MLRTFIFVILFGGNALASTTCIEDKERNQVDLPRIVYVASDMIKNTQTTFAGPKASEVARFVDFSVNQKFNKCIETDNLRDQISFNFRQETSCPKTNFKRSKTICLEEFLKDNEISLIEAEPKLLVAMMDDQKNMKQMDSKTQTVALIKISSTIPLKLITEKINKSLKKCNALDTELETHNFSSSLKLVAKTICKLELDFLQKEIKPHINKTITKKMNVFGIMLTDMPASFTKWAESSFEKHNVKLEKSLARLDRKISSYTADLGHRPKRSIANK